MLYVHDNRSSKPVQFLHKSRQRQPRVISDLLYQYYVISLHYLVVMVTGDVVTIT